MNELIGFQTPLIAPLTKTATTLPIADDKLGSIKTKLPDGKHSYLQITDNVGYEIVKVIRTDNQLTLQRGQETTTATTFPKGALVTYVLTPQAVLDIISEMECCP